ncbi:Zinc transporter ZIP14 [Trichoplax sp. H2]|nr:Zinc transporter ZIP14 [Trichoplax sp. H2]|eukprot:RDD41796.1 Zinc transporter ZIP14 [Trichoplax sp. H2]
MINMKLLLTVIFMSSFTITFCHSNSYDREFLDYIYHKYDRRWRGNGQHQLALSDFSRLLRDAGLNENNDTWVSYSDRNLTLFRRYLILEATGHYDNITECLSSRDFFIIANAKEKYGISYSQFSSICPAILQQVLSKACKNNTKYFAPPSNKAQDLVKMWGFGILFTTIICLGSVLGAAILPFMNGATYKKAMIFMIALAVSTLSGNAVLHLIPGAFNLGLDPKTKYEELVKGIAVLGGIYFFYIFDKLIIHLSKLRNANLASKEEDVDVGIVRMNSISYQINTRNPDTTNEEGVEVVTKKKPKVIASVAWLILIGDALHNFTDGLAMGAAFKTSIPQGISTSIAILCEEVPHELGDFAILVNSGMSVKRAAMCNFFCASTCFIGLAFGILIGEDPAASQYIFGVAAGIFLYISLAAMLPEMTEQLELSDDNGEKKAKKSSFWSLFLIQNIGLLTGFGIMIVLAVYENDIQI